MSSSTPRGRVGRLCRLVLVVVLVCSMMAAAAAPAAAFVRGEPDLSVTLSDGTVQPGAETTLDLTLANSGEIDIGATRPELQGKEQLVTTARGTVVSVSPRGRRNPVTVDTGEVALGSVPEGARSVPVRVSVPEDAAPGTYRLDVEVAYEHYDLIPGSPVNRYGEEQVTDEFTVAVTVEEAARFEVVEASTDAPVGGAGEVELTVANVGSANASDASLSLESRNAALSLDGSPAAEAFLGDLAAGDRRTVTFGADVAPATASRPLSLAGTVTYDDADGDQRRATLSTGVTPESDRQFSVTRAGTSATVGTQGALTVALRNEGNRTLTDATVRLESGNAALSFGGSPTARTFVGPWEPGEVREVTVENAFTPAAEPRNYAVDAVVSYTGSTGRTVQAAPVTVGVVPGAGQRFATVRSETTAAVGSQGALTVALRNEGNRTLTDATVRLESGNAALSFGGSPTARTFVGPWEPGEVREVTVENAFTPAAEPRNYAVDATVSYTGATGTTERANPVTVGVRPAPEQGLDLVDHGTTLRVGSEGRLTGTFVNEGPGDVENAVLVLEPPANVVTAEREYAIGDLAANASVDFRYDVDVSAEARQGPRQFTYRLRYDDATGETVTSDPLFARGTVAPKRDTFAVSTDASLAAGSTETVEIRVTNDGDERLTSVSAKLFADDPISASNDEAFVESLDPGETATMRFRLSAAGDAIAEPYPVSLDFQYEEPDGDTKISDSYAVGIDVTEGGGGGLLSVTPLAGAGLGLGVVLSLGGLAAVGLGLVGRPE